MQNSKKLLINVAIIIFIFIVIFGVILVKTQSNKEKSEKGKEEIAESLKSNEFVDGISKINWKDFVSENCNIDIKGIRENRFSWLNKTGLPQIMDGHNLNILFVTKDSSKCCGNVSNIYDKLKSYLLYQGFTLNENNTILENYIYSFENYGMKCVFGYKNVENKESFCELGIICGRINSVLTSEDFQKIYGVFNEIKPHPMVVIDKTAETLYGKFARGRVGYVLYLNTGNDFIAKLNEEGAWSSLDKPFEEERKINKCGELLANKVPPSIAEATCYDQDMQPQDYTKLYNEKYK